MQEKAQSKTHAMSQATLAVLVLPNNIVPQISISGATDMLDKLMNAPYSINDTAHHEAAHAVMCLMTGCYVERVKIYSEPKDGYLGRCLCEMTSDWKKNVWVYLAGPAMDSIRTSAPMFVSYIRGGGEDFDQALDLFHTALLPRPEAGIREFVPLNRDVLDLMAEDVLEGRELANVPANVRRKVAVYLEQYAAAVDSVHDLIHAEAETVRQTLLDNKCFQTFIPAVANALLEKRQLTHADLIKICTAAAEGKE